MKKTACSVILSVSFLAITANPVSGQNGKGAAKLPETSEVFRVSRVGQGGAAETRELLLSLYEEIGKEYNAKIAKEVEAKKVAYRGNQIRILKKLSEKDAGDSMYLVAYQGRPSVVTIDADEEFRGGDLTPALKMEEAGTHSTEVTRYVTEKKTVTREPELEKVEPSGGGVTFFGIPLDTGGGGGSSAPVEEVITNKKKVTEVKTMPKYTATISKEVNAEGPPKFSKEIFMASVKNGEIYTVKRVEDRRCQNCRGFQRVTTTAPVGFRAPDGKMPCPECRAVGKIKWDVTYQIAY